MKRIATCLLATLALLVLPGCLQNETTIHLNKDGSGTVVDQTTFGAQMLEMLDQMAGFGGGGAAAPPKDPVADTFSEEKGKARAATMGEGVTFVSSEPIKTATGRGARMTFKFADINMLQLSMGDNLKTLSPMGGGEAPAGPKAKPMGFSYAGGKLVMTMPEPEKPAAETPKPEAPDMDNPQAEAMMKQMLGDMKISLKLVAESGIAETDATYHDGKSITLVEMDMGKVIAQPGAMKKLNSADRNDPAAAMEALKGIDGMKMETKKQVVVKVN